MTEAVLETMEFCSKPQAYEKGYENSNICTSGAIRCKLAVTSIKNDRQIRIRMEFDWDRTEIENITGTVTVMFYSATLSGWTKFETHVDVEKRGQCIETVFESRMSNVSELCYDYMLTIHRSPRDRVLYDKMFAPSEQTDTVLVIGEKKLYVNKAFLSYHSAYFRTLFATNLDMENGIPIQDVTYDEFGLLMSTIYPGMVPVTEKTAELLLSLGQRFEMPAVMHHVENLLHHHKTKLPYKQLLKLADKYNLQKLLKSAIEDSDSLSKFVNNSPINPQLSDATKAKILDRLTRQCPSGHVKTSSPHDERTPQPAIAVFYMFIIIFTMAVLVILPLIESDRRK